MPGNWKADVKLGYFIGIGLFLLALTVMLLQYVAGGVKGR